MESLELLSFGVRTRELDYCRTRDWTTAGLENLTTVRLENGNSITTFRLYLLFYWNTVGLENFPTVGLETRLL